jgi:ParB/RepB/Spo0J family partition protein
MDALLQTPESNFIPPQPTQPKSPLTMEFDEIDPRDLTPHPDNREIDEEEEEFILFCSDVRDKGILQPLLVTKDKVVLAGHRRRLAAIRVGITKVPVFYRTLKPGESAGEYFLSENEQRTGLTLLEEALTLKRIKDETGLSGKDLARRTNRNAEHIRSCLRLLELDPVVQEYFHRQMLPANSIKTFFKLVENSHEQIKYANMFVAGKLTVEGFERIISRKEMPPEGTGDENEDFENVPEKRAYMKQIVPYGNTAATRQVSREETIGNLLKSGGNSISMHLVKQVLEATCCYCGMQNEPTICSTCPTLVFANGLLGRSSGGKGSNYFDEDDEM